MDDVKREDVTIKVKRDWLYEPPEIESYSEEELLDLLGTAHSGASTITCDPFTELF